MAVSKDGSHVYYAEQGKGSNMGWLYAVPSLGGPPRKVLYDIDTPVSFSPDGKRMAFIRGYVAEDTEGHHDRGHALPLLRAGYIDDISRDSLPTRAWSTSAAPSPAAGRLQRRQHLQFVRAN